MNIAERLVIENCRSEINKLTTELQIMKVDLQTVNQQTIKNLEDDSNVTQIVAMFARLGVLRYIMDAIEKEK